MHLLRHSRTPARHGSSLSGRGWCGPWCPCHGIMCGTVRRHLLRCRSLAVRSVRTLPGGGLQLGVGPPRALDGVVEPHSQSSQGLGHAMEPVAPPKGCEVGGGIVHLGADAMRAGKFPDHPGGLGAHGGRAVVDERAHEGQRRLVASCWHPCEFQGPVVL